MPNVCLSILRALIYVKERYNYRQKFTLPVELLMIVCKLIINNACGIFFFKFIY